MLNWVKLLVIVSLFSGTLVWIDGPCSAQAVGIDLRETHRSGLVLVHVLDSTNSLVGHGSGFVALSYELGGPKIMLITARHVLIAGSFLDVRIGSYGKGFFSILTKPVPLWDTAGVARYWTYENDSGVVSDLAILPIYNDERRRGILGLDIIPRSTCVFSDSIEVGDHILAFGYGDPKLFPFVLKGGFIATSGIVAFESADSYALDVKLHHGMSGGVCFKELPVKGGYRLRICGIVSAKMDTYTDYSWITKLDYIDSMYIQHTGKGWGK